MKHFPLLTSLLLLTFNFQLSTFAQSEQQIESILSRMTLDEKIAIISPTVLTLSLARGRTD